MRRIASLAQRSAIEWSVRSILAVIVASLGYLTVTQSVAPLLQDKDPAKAHRLDPSNGVITGRWSQALSGPQATNADRVRSDAIARLALLQDPVSIEAAATLGTNAALRADTAAARQWFSYSETLSRRDLRTQIWAIQDAAARNDIPGALKHYDTILRTSHVAATILLPALATAINYSEVREPLVEILSRQPSWTQGFINYVSARGQDPENTSLFLRALAAANVPISDAATASLIKALVDANKFEQAWAYYAFIHPGASRQTSRDPQFAVASSPPSLFDWRSINDGNISAAIQRSGQANVFTFSAPSSTGGQVLRQFEVLSPNDYLLEGVSKDIEQPEDAQPYWSLNCFGGGEIDRVVLPNSAVANGEFSKRVRIPANCPVQVLALNIRPSDEISGVEGEIKRVLLRPIHP